MNNGIHDCPTWVHFQLHRPLPVLVLARLVGSEILSAGFTLVGEAGSGWGARSTLANGKSGLSADSIIDVIPVDGTLLTAVGVRFEMQDRDLEISFRIGEARYPPFDANTTWDNFLLRVNCRMDRVRLQGVAENYTDERVIQSALRVSKSAYHVVKHPRRW